MLSIWILGVRDVRRPSQESYCVDNGPILWAVQVTNGSQQHRTQFLPLPAGQGEDERLSGDKSRWEEEVEIADKGDQETVEIALLFDLAPKTTLGRKLYRHSVTSIEMRTFRAQPEKKVNMWKPLRSAVPNFDADLGKIHLSVMYSDDSGDHGYFFALFCGLLPPRNLSLAQG